MSVAADFPRQINQRNDDGNCADDLPDCTNRFPIHGMIHVIASGIQSHCAVRSKRLKTTTEIVGFVKYWEIIADNLSKAGWSWGCVSAVDANGQTIWVADAHRGDGKRFVVHADEKLTAFLELQRAIHEFAVDLIS